MQSMTSEEKIKLITRNLEETLTEEDLKRLIYSKQPLKHYIGVEISGKVHIGWFYLMLKIADLQKAGAETTVFLADWHTWLNKKLDGTLETAKRLALEYFAQALKATAVCAGADPNKINFVLGSDLYKENGNFWAEVIRVAKATTVARMIRSTTIMGRKENEISDTAMLIYPAMQAADIFTMGMNLAHAGMDQRKIHVIARDAAESLGHKKPVCIHQHLLLGLLKPSIWPITEENKEEATIALKMSKSKPDSAIFIHDAPEDIRRKINQAFAPEGETGFNPILDWIKHIVFYHETSKLTILREEKFGGDITYAKYADLEKDYVDKKLHPMDLKNALATYLIETLEPARKYFEEPNRKKALQEIESLTSR